MIDAVTKTMIDPFKIKLTEQELQNVSHVRRLMAYMSTCCIAAYVVSIILLPVSRSPGAGMGMEFFETYVAPFWIVGPAYVDFIEQLVLNGKNSVATYVALIVAVSFVLALFCIVNAVKILSIVHLDYYIKTSQERDKSLFYPLYKEILLGVFGIFLVLFLVFFNMYLFDYYEMAISRQIKPKFMLLFFPVIPQFIVMFTMMFMMHIKKIFLSLRM
jgi:hypothetical protein